MSRSTANKMESRVQHKPKIAVLIPCYNEELTVTEVVKSFRNELPDSDIYVFDNNSDDRTVELALAAGATVMHEPRQGKGFVVQAMFREVEADIYVMVDGDNTLPPGDVHRLIEPVLNGQADMVVGSRLQVGTSEFRKANRWGNRLVLGLLNSIFGVHLTDILSGYRAINRKFVKSLPLFGGGFEIETELTIKAIARGWRIVEIPTTMTSRPEGSHSKVKFVRDGAIIINTVLSLFRDYRPLTFFGSVGLLLFVLALIPETYISIQALKTGNVTHTVWAILSVGVSLTGVLLVVAGLILHTIVRRFQELEHTLQMKLEDHGQLLTSKNGDN